MYSIHMYSIHMYCEVYVYYKVGGPHTSGIKSKLG